MLVSTRPDLSYSLVPQTVNCGFGTLSGAERRHLLGCMVQLMA
uniref:Guanine nucleotide-binding protein subunit beta-like protein 1 isoform X3 n=1 Tax=Rhizophora mucronata TaxID=61149 RepID=A0A2P2QW32_RHIMU